MSHVSHINESFHINAPHTHIHTPPHAHPHTHIHTHMFTNLKTCHEPHLHSTSCVHCNTLQHTATHCNTLQHTATHCNMLPQLSSALECALQHTAKHCKILQHTATHCNTLEFTTIHRQIDRQIYTFACIYHTGWLRLVGSLKIQVSFAEYSLIYRALLQKRPAILRSLLIVSTPYLPDPVYDLCSLSVCQISGNRFIYRSVHINKTWCGGADAAGYDQQAR